MRWSSHPCSIDDPIAIAWRADGAAAVIAGHDAVEWIDITRPGARRLVSGLEDVEAVAFAGDAIVVAAGGELVSMIGGVERARREAGGPLIPGAPWLVSASGLERLGPDLETATRIEVSGAIAAFAGSMAAVAGEREAALVDLGGGSITSRIVLAGEASALAVSPGGGVLAATGDGVWLHRSGAAPRGLGDRDALGFSGERPVVGATIYTAGGDPRRQLRAGGSAVRPAAIAPRPGGGLGLLCDRVLHVIDAGDDPRQTPGLDERIDALAVRGDLLAAAAGCQIAVFDRGAGAIRSRWDCSSTYGALCLELLDPETLLVGSERVEVWRWRERRRVAIWDAELESIKSIRFRRGRVLVVGYRGAAAFAPSGEQLASYRFDGSIAAGDLFPSSPHLALALDRGPLLVCDDAGAEVARLDEASHVAVTERHILAGRFGEARAVPWPPGDAGVPTRPAFTAASAIDGGALWSDGDNVGLFDETGEREEWIARYRDGASAIAAAPGLERFYTSGRSPWIGERSIESGALTRVFAAGAGNPISAVALAPDGGHLVAGDAGGRVAVWALDDPPRRIGFADSSSLPISDRFEPGAFGPIERIALGDELVVAGRAVFRWKRPLAGDIGRRDPDRREIRAGALSADGRRAVIVSWDRPLEIVAIASGDVLAEVPALEGYRTRVTLSPAGERVLIADDETLAVWSVDEGSLVGRLDVDRQIRGAVPCGDDVLVWLDRRQTERGRPGLVARWSPERSTVERWLPDAGVDLGGADGIAVAGNRALVWTGELGVLAGDGAILAVLPPHRGRIQTAAVSADGQLAVTADDAGLIRLHDGRGELRWELVSTADGSWWRRAAGGELEWEPSANLAEGRFG